MAEKRKPGRPSIGAEKLIGVKATDHQHLKFLRLGGSAWLRGVLDATPLPRCALPAQEKFVTTRVNETQHARFLLLGGSAWLRATLDAAPMPTRRLK